MEMHIKQMATDLRYSTNLFFGARLRNNTIHCILAEVFGRATYMRSIEEH
jgi:hypothetical protein